MALTRPELAYNFRRLCISSERLLAIDAAQLLVLCSTVLLPLFVNLAHPKLAN